MGQELLDIKGRTRKPRTYYLATTSTGMKFLRGSWQDVYSHAVVCSKSPHFRPHQVETYGSCSSRENLAKRSFNRHKKHPQEGWEWELIELQKVTAQEFRAIKRASKKEWEQHRKETLERLEKRRQEESLAEGKETEITNDNTTNAIA